MQEQMPGWIRLLEEDTNLFLPSDLRVPGIYSFDLGLVSGPAPTPLSFCSQGELHHTFLVLWLERAE